MIRGLKRQMKSLFFDGEVLKLMSLTFLMKPIGLVTQVLLAKYYGAGVHYDAYVLSVFLVSFVAQLVGRVFSAVAIPHLADLKSRLGLKEQSAYVNALVGLGIVPVALFSLILIFRGNWIVDLAAPNAPEETRLLAIRMLRAMALPGILVAIIQIYKSVLDINRAFRVSALMPFINAAVTLAVLIAVHDSLGIWALPAAFTASFCVQAVIIVGVTTRRGFVRIVLPRAHFADLRALWQRTWMVLVDSVLLVINTFMDKVFASSLVAGSISAIAYANTLMNLGMQLFQFSLVTVMFTRMSEDIAGGNIASCNRYVDDNLRRLSRLSVPVSLAIFVASPELVQVLFQRDAFTADDTARTASVLAMYMLGLPAFLINLVIARVFHSLKKLRDKMWLALQYLVTNVAGNILLVGPLQVTGLAISSTLAINIHLALSLVVLARYRTGFDIRRIWRHIGVNYGLGLATWLIYRYCGPDNLLNHYSGSGGQLGAILLGAARGIIVIVIYAGLMTTRRRLERALRRGDPTAPR